MPESRSSRAVGGDEGWCHVEERRLVRAKRLPGYEMGKLKRIGGKMGDWQSELFKRWQLFSAEEYLEQILEIEKGIFKKKPQIRLHCCVSVLTRYPAISNHLFFDCAGIKSDWQEAWTLTIWQVNQHWREALWLSLSIILCYYLCQPHSDQEGIKF